LWGFVEVTRKKMKMTFKGEVITNNSHQNNSIPSASNKEQHLYKKEAGATYNFLECIKALRATER